MIVDVHVVQQILKEPKNTVVLVGDNHVNAISYLLKVSGYEEEEGKLSVIHDKKRCIQK